ncbi:MAG: hypothetical protein GXO94_04450 [Nitrospirae bacterium]|nr:hypothetical protein [Nitrospirota bacterium]
MMERRVLYFEKPGRDNTEDCLRIVRDVVEEGGIRDLVIASTTGDTGIRFTEALKDKDLNIVVVTHSQGFREPNTIEIPDEAVEKIEANGARVYTGTMITHSLETSLSSKFSGLYPTLIVAQSLRRFGEGPKVCCEMAMMAVDAGLVPEGAEVLTVAGTGRGADTVMIVKSAASKRFLDLRVLEILAKPRS